jgi:hypothetical protein
LGFGGGVCPPTPNPQIPNPQSPIPILYLFEKHKNIKRIFKIKIQFYNIKIK